MLEKRNLSKDPYQNLANMIVLQAVQDWRTAYRASKRAYGIYSDITWRKVYECESFFRSEWFQTLTNGRIDGKKLIQMLREQEDEKWERKQTQKK